MLRYFAAVVPPPEVTERIAAFSKEVDSVYAAPVQNAAIKVVAKDGMEPYPNWNLVTLKLASETKPFEIRFGKPRYFGEYLLGIPVISQELVEAHFTSVKLLAEHDDYISQKSPDELAEFYESQSIFTPHITLAAGIFGNENFFGLNIQRRAILKKAASHLNNLPSFTATEFVLYEALTFDRTYEPKGVIPLGVTQPTISAPVGLPQLVL